MAKTRATAWLCIVLMVGSLSSGCEFFDTFSAHVRADKAGRITFEALFKACAVNLGGDLITTIFFCGFLSAVGLESSQGTAQHEAGATVNFIFFDPVIVQFPADVSNFSGTFNDGMGNVGNLVIQSNLASVPVDLNTTLSAEPGNQLVIVSLPTPPPPLGNNYQFTLDFTVGTAAPINVKAIITGLATINGQNFYPPLFPCVTNFAALPSATIPLNATLQDVLFPVAGLQGCAAGQVYQYANVIVGIPSIPEWGLILLALSLLAVATWQLAGRPVLVGAGTTGSVAMLPDRRHWITPLLLGQGVATLGLGFYAVLVGPLVPHDGIGAFLAGILIGLMVECYRRGRSL